MKPKIVAASAAVACILLAAWPTAAQSPCSIALGEGLKAYEIGRFNQVIDLLQECSQGSRQATRNEQVEALRLVAMTLLLANV